MASVAELLPRAARLKYELEVQLRAVEQGAGDAGDCGMGLRELFTQIDINGDGWMDIFVTIGVTGVADELYLNDGSGAFIEVGALAGVADTGRAMSAAVGDFDNDGVPEIYVARLNTANLLYRKTDAPMAARALFVRPLDASGHTHSAATFGAAQLQALKAAEL